MIKRVLVISPCSKNIMNMTHGFDTYRKCKNLQQLYHDIYSIKSTTASVKTALFSCSEYFTNTPFTPDSLITSISNLLIEKIQEFITRNNAKKTIETIVTQHIYDLTYSSTSSSIWFFIEHLHKFCDSLETVKPKKRTLQSVS